MVVSSLYYLIMEFSKPGPEKSLEKELFVGRIYRFCQQAQKFQFVDKVVTNLMTRSKIKAMLPVKRPDLFGGFAHDRALTSHVD